jgi:acetyl/propionyl-CoA carboxylase alpha subunit
MAGHHATLRHDGGEYTVTVSPDGVMTVEGRQFRVEGRGAERRVGGRTVWVAGSGDVRWVFIDGRVLTFERLPAGGRRGRAGPHHGTLMAPMPATVLRVPVGPGDRVAPGDTLILLEAMKMELPIRATAAGIVEAVHCREGELVQPGVGLIDIEED